MMDGMSAAQPGPSPRMLTCPDLGKEASSWQLPLERGNDTQG